MAKHRFQTIRMMRTAWLLVLAALIAGLGVAPSWAGERYLPNPHPRLNSGQTATATPARSAKTPAQGKGTISSSSLGAGKRDPFKLPEISTGKPGSEGALNSMAGAVLPAGVRGLLIPQLMVEGVVREDISNKMIAVVVNETKRAYFLRVNDSLYDGVVSKITPDTVYFKENVLDADGRVTTREVAKRLGAAPGEGR